MEILMLKTVCPYRLIFRTKADFSVRMLLLNVDINDYVGAFAIADIVNAELKDGECSSAANYSAAFKNWNGFPL